MATTTDQQPQSNASPSLSLPASHFAKLSPASFLAAHLPSSRPSKRTPQQSRPPTIQKGSLTHANGSAVVRVGDTATVCGVRAETLDAADTNAPHILGTLPAGRKDADVIFELGLLVPNIELATGCNPQHMPGNPPTTLAQSLTQRVLTLLRITDLLKLEDLEIWDQGIEGAKEDAMDDDDDDDDEDENGDGDGEFARKPRVRAYWTLYIDILIISLDGSPFDAAWGSVLAALGDVVLPRAWWDMDREGVLCDPRAEQGKRLSLRGCPIPMAFGVFTPPEGVGSKKFKDEVYVLADPDDFEEGCCQQEVSAVVDESGAKVLRLEMGGGTLLTGDDLGKLVTRTGERWKEWNSILK